jgi:hypothetical protein
MDIGALRLHGLAERVPAATEPDLGTLRRSLQEHGQQDPLDITPDGVILDGRTRWTLLKEQGAQTILVRVQDIPEGQQVAWIVDRALARRHLTLAQKQDLNTLLKEQVLEVKGDKRIGLGQSQRAEMLGVTRETVKQWDKEQEAKVEEIFHDEQGGVFTPPSEAPTHFSTTRKGAELDLPIHIKRERKTKQNTTLTKGKTPPRLTARPKWLTMFFSWTNRPLPEYKPTLLEMRERIDKALDTLEKGT